ncbi:hypothetical protein TNCV_489111 [Trichonephila clavipes]|nr:hypothetical protein TNCV_489111 [Trichonephila clavipes]
MKPETASDDLSWNESTDSETINKADEKLLNLNIICQFFPNNAPCFKQDTIKENLENIPQPEQNEENKNTLTGHKTIYEIRSRKSPNSFIGIHQESKLTSILPRVQSQRIRGKYFAILPVEIRSSAQLSKSVTLVDAGVIARRKLTSHPVKKFFNPELNYNHVILTTLAKKG